MPLQDLTEPPTPPQRSDAPEVFIERADAFVAWFATFVAQMNTLGTQLEAAASLLAIAPGYSDPGLVALTGNTLGVNKVPYFNGSSTSALATFTAAARTFVAAADAAAQRTALGLGTAATQASGAFESAGAVASHVAAGDPHGQYLLEGAVSAFGMTLLDDPDAAAARVTLGVDQITASGNSLHLGAMILKWGTGGAGSNVFPEAFPTQCDAVVYSLAGNIGQSDESDEIHYISAKSAAGFTISIDGDHTWFPSVYWFAVGS